MADDGLDGLEENGASFSASKKGGIGGALPGLLKWVAIALGAIILIVVIVVVTYNIMSKNTPGTPSIPISDEYVTQREILDWYTSLFNATSYGHSLCLK